MRRFAAVRKKEGIIGGFADVTLDDDMYGETTYEKAERKMLVNSISLAIEKGGFNGNRTYDVPFVGRPFKPDNFGKLRRKALQFPVSGRLQCLLDHERKHTFSRRVDRRGLY